MERLRFETVNLELHSQVCVAFREDSFVVSFGNADKFFESDGCGNERYLTWLQTKISKDANSAVHVWSDHQIIGQIELGRLKEDPSKGYVNLYYLKPEVRGQGFGTQLDHYAMSYFKNLGLTSARLSVSPTNLRALAYYAKMGWVDLGPRPGHPEVHCLEKHTRT